MLLLCFGYGYVAQQLAQQWPGRVVGTTRDGRAGSLRYADGEISPEVIAAIEVASHILISTPPHEGETQLIAAIARYATSCRWLGYLSTSGVYGDYRGGVVTEDSPLRATQPRAVARIAAEERWRAQGAHLFRLSGIYGPGRSAFDAIAQGRGQRIHKPGHRFNRIHVDDIARALAASMQAPTPGAIYNLADDQPASQSDVLGYAYQLLGQVPPVPVAYAAADLSPMARQFYDGSRWVSASKIKRIHGLTWEFSTYREGLAAILKLGSDFAR